MSAAPTPKELLKAVGSFARAPSLPLPADLVQIIETFVYERTEKPDDNVADKVHDELLAIFKQDIAHDPARYAAFIALLRHLRPMIGQPAKVLQWFELLLPVLDHISRGKELAYESQRIVLDILTEGDDNSRAASLPVAEKMISLWFHEAELLRTSPDVLQDFKERHLRETLLLYGKKRPKDFMAVMDQFVCKPSYRARSLLLLSSFVQSQPPHLHLILDTPLFHSLLTCLRRDTSTITISLALTVLTMVLPHAPSSLVPHLPTLFNIYARLLFWDRELSARNTAGDGRESGLSISSAWEICSFSPHDDNTTISHILDYFTTLYGLYPINFMDYIRKPQRYLRHAEVPDEDIIEVQPTEIRHASERFRRCHILHENFYTLTIDSEKTDFGRWIKSDPAEVVADCLALRQSADEFPDAVPPGISQMFSIDSSDVDNNDKESALLSGSTNIGPSGSGHTRRTSGSSLSQSGFQVNPALVRRSSQSSRRSQSDSPSIKLPENDYDSQPLVTSTSQTQLQELMNSNKAVKSSLHQSLANDSVASLSLSHHESLPEKASSQIHSKPPSFNMQFSDATANDKESKLFRYVYLLYNDLMFERFLKQQHLTHIGGLRRQHVREAAGEAETQNIITANKHLKQRLEDAKKAETRAKTEAEKSRTLAKKWEADLFKKLTALRDEQKKWHAQEEAFSVELKAAKEEAEALRLLVGEVEVRELGLKQNIQSADVNFGELKRLRREVEGLTESERNYQAKEAERQAAMTQAAEADSCAKAVELQLAARESDFAQIQKQYESHIEELNSKLQDALKSSGERNADSLKAQYNAALEASRATHVEITKRMHELSRKNTELQTELYDIHSRMANLTGSQSADTEDDDSSSSDSPQNPSISDEQLLEAKSGGATPLPESPKAEQAP
ncbi:hypothetical protein F4808DRAFT_437981 [Astrocystis sublimbata]|nr:hypothetical protein F4808DRAFT_437981 [Astrocystis sublimbata]